MCRAEEEALPKVRFEREDLTVEAKPGQNLLEVCEKAGVVVFRGMWPEPNCGDSRGNTCKDSAAWTQAWTEITS